MWSFPGGYIFSSGAWTGKPPPVLSQLLVRSMAAWNARFRSATFAGWWDSHQVLEGINYSAFLLLLCAWFSGNKLTITAVDLSADALKRHILPLAHWYLAMITSNNFLPSKPKHLHVCNSYIWTYVLPSLSPLTTVNEIRQKRGIVSNKIPRRWLIPYSSAVMCWDSQLNVGVMAYNLDQLPPKKMVFEPRLVL